MAAIVRRKAPLTLAVACGVAVGSIGFAFALADRRWGFVLAFTVALLAGEAFGMISTGERVLASRDTAAEPVRLQTIKRKEAERRLADARAISLLTTPRLEAALASKKTAEAAVASEAAKNGCASNCRALLNKAVDDAAAEVSAARRDLEAQQMSAQREVEAATAALEALPAPKSETLLADKLGIAGSTLDLIAAALASLGANGLGASLLAYGVHRTKPAAAVVTPRSSVVPATYFAADLEVPAVTARRTAPETPAEHAAKLCS